MRQVLLIHVLQLLAGVRQDHHRVRDLLPQLMKFFVSLFDLLVEGLVFDLELFEVDEVEAVCELLLLLEDLLLVGEAVPQGDVLQAELVHLLVLLELALLLHPDVVRLDLLPRATVHCVLGDTAFQFLELGLNFLALRLLLIKLGLKLSSHLIVAVLSLLEIEADLMHVSQCIKVFMFIHLLSVSLRVSITGNLMSLLLVHGGVHEHDLPLELLVVSLQGVLLAEGLLDRDDKLSPQLVLLVQVGNLVDAVVVIALVHVFVIVGRAVVTTRLANRVHLGGALGFAVDVGGLSGTLVLLSLGLFGAGFLRLPSGAPSRGVLFGVVVNAGGFGGRSFLTSPLLLLLSDHALCLTDEFLLLLTLSAVGSVPLFLLSVVSVLNDGAGVRQELHGDPHCQLQMRHVDPFLGGDSVLDLVDL